MPRGIMGIGLIVLLAGMSSAQAENRAIIFGGADTPNNSLEKQVNRFLYNVEVSSAAFVEAGWSVHALFGGVEARCELPSTDPRCAENNSDPLCCPSRPELWSNRHLAELLAKNPSDIPLATRESLISELRRARDELHAGDQLLLQISTHGGVDVFCGPADHANSNCAPIPFNDPEIMALLRELKEVKHVSLGFAINSCHGGSAIPVYSELGCVVTAAARNEYSFGTSNRRTTVGPSGTFTSEPSLRMRLDFIGSLDPLLTEPRVSSTPMTLEDLFISEMTRSVNSCIQGPRSLFFLSPNPQISGYTVEHAEDLPAPSTAAIGNVTPCPNPESNGFPFSANEMRSIHETLQRFETLAAVVSGGDESTVELSRIYGVPGVQNRPATLAALRARMRLLQEPINRWNERWSARTYRIPIPLPGPVLRAVGRVLRQRQAPPSDDNVNGFGLQTYRDGFEYGHYPMNAFCALLKNNFNFAAASRDTLALLSMPSSTHTQLTSSIASALRTHALRVANRHPEIREACSARPDTNEFHGIYHQIRELESFSRCDADARRLQHYIASRDRLLTAPDASLSAAERTSRQQIEHCRSFRLTSGSAR